MLRISGGTHKGRHLKAPAGQDTRPTSDMVRQALFNLLGQRLDDPLVLDVFAGTGALGLEALSRGAQRAWFVDKARHPIQAIQDNARAMGVEDRCKVVTGDAAVELLKLPAGAATLALVDPPYAFRERAPLFAALAHALVPDGMLVFETALDDALEDAPPAFERQDKRSYGSTTLHLLIRRA